MPSASLPEEQKVVRNVDVPELFKKAFDVVAGKIEDLEKRRSKIESKQKDLQKAKAGSTKQDKKHQQPNSAPPPPAAEEPSKVEEIDHALEFGKEILADLRDIINEENRNLKMKIKRDFLNRLNGEIQLVKELFIIQEVLNGMGSESVRNDFLQGNRGAILLSNQNLRHLDEIFKMTSPSRNPEDRDPDVSYEASLLGAAEHLVSLIQARKRFVIGGTSYKDLKQLIDRIYESGYFENNYEELEGENDIEQLNVAPEAASNDADLVADQADYTNEETSPNNEEVAEEEYEDLPEEQPVTTTTRIINSTFHPTELHDVLISNQQHTPSPPPGFQTQQTPLGLHPQQAPIFQAPQPQQPPPAQAAPPDNEFQFLGESQLQIQAREQIQQQQQMMMPVPNVPNHTALPQAYQQQQAQMQGFSSYQAVQAGAGLGVSPTLQQQVVPQSASYGVGPNLGLQPAVQSQAHSSLGQNQAAPQVTSYQRQYENSSLRTEDGQGSAVTSSYQPAEATQQSDWDARTNRVSESERHEDKHGERMTSWADQTQDDHGDDSAGVGGQDDEYGGTFDAGNRDNWRGGFRGRGRGNFNRGGYQNNRGGFRDGGPAYNNNRRDNNPPTWRGGRQDGNRGAPNDDRVWNKGRNDENRPRNVDREDRNGSGGSNDWQQRNRSNNWDPQNRPRGSSRGGYNEGYNNNRDWSGGRGGYRGGSGYSGNNFGGRPQGSAGFES